MASTFRLRNRLFLMLPTGCRRHTLWLNSLFGKRYSVRLLEIFAVNSSVMVLRVFATLHPLSLYVSDTRWCVYFLGVVFCVGLSSDQH